MKDSVLEPLGITVIPDDEASRAVPWLEAGEDVMLSNFEMEDLSAATR